MRQPPVILAALCLLTACDSAVHSPSGPAPCTDDWKLWVEQTVPTGDGRGHGPDIGSDEWQSVIEFKLGVRGRPSVPGRQTRAWCVYIDNLIATDARED